MLSLLMDFFENPIVFVGPLVGKSTRTGPYPLAPRPIGRGQRFDDHLNRLAGWNAWLRRDHWYGEPDASRQG